MTLKILTSTNMKKTIYLKKLRVTLLLGMLLFSISTYAQSPLPSINTFTFGDWMNLQKGAAFAKIGDGGI